MKSGLNPCESEFWLDCSQFSNYIEDSSDSSFTIDLIKLISVKNAISNFVLILGRKNIPVSFKENTSSKAIDGKKIIISANITNKRDFDVAVGLALHETAHIILSDFELIKMIWMVIPSDILKLASDKKITLPSLEKFILDLYNIIEDRYIDAFIFNEAPGYQGYYVALYDKYINNEEIQSLLQSDIFRYPSIKSYLFRICNLTNIGSDNLALPNLDVIISKIDICNILRLETSQQRLDLVFEVVKIILNSLDKQNLNLLEKSKSLANPEDYFDFSEDGEDGEDTVDDTDLGTAAITEISNVFNQRDINTNSNDVVDKISNSEISNNELNDIDKVVENQRSFIKNEFPKEGLESTTSTLVDLFEKSGVDLVKINYQTEKINVKINCIVVRKLSMGLILTGNKLFPLSTFYGEKVGEGIPDPPEDINLAVKAGICLGTKLGRKLQIYNEEVIIKSIYKKSGKLYTRHLHKISYDDTNIFYKTNIEMLAKTNIHISVDASSSMIGEKWEKTITSVVAICKALSYVNNVHTTVSFRTTQDSYPYVVLAYDSNIDSISKIEQLFPYLTPNGFTPEGLAYDSIFSIFSEISPDEENRYLINFSDGEPCFSIRTGDTNIQYNGKPAVKHTRDKINKIKNCGIKVLSYFITYSDSKDDTLISFFKEMYGPDARFINVNDLLPLATTINQFLLPKA